jgi:hypothetical protein
MILSFWTFFILLSIFSFLLPFYTLFLRLFALNILWILWVSLIILRSFILSYCRFILAYCLPLLDSLFLLANSLIISFSFCSYYLNHFLSFLFHLNYFFLRNPMTQLFMIFCWAILYGQECASYFLKAQNISFEIKFTGLIVVFYIYSFYSFYILMLFFQIIVAFLDLWYNCSPCTFQSRPSKPLLLKTRMDTFI